MYFTLVIDTDGNPVGSHAYAEAPASLPTDEVECTQEQAQSPSEWVVANGSVVAPPLADRLKAAQSAKIAELSAACEAAITGGFQSSALGAAHVYPSKETDQVNLSTAVTKTLLPSFGASDTVSLVCVLPANVSDESWPRVAHTATQAQQVESDKEAWVDTQLQRFDSLKKTVLAVTADGNDPVATVDAVAWPTAP